MRKNYLYRPNLEPRNRKIHRAFGIDHTALEVLIRERPNQFHFVSAPRIDTHRKRQTRRIERSSFLRLMCAKTRELSWVAGWRGRTSCKIEHLGGGRTCWLHRRPFGKSNNL